MKPVRDNKICAYLRISVDDDPKDLNTSIENQRKIIEEYAESHFPNLQVDFYEDRDKSGYTFEQRTSYQKMRLKIFQNNYSILMIKDFSRFSRRNSKGLVELEDLRDAGMRIISIGDQIDYPTFDDWLNIQFRFLINEMPVTDTSKKIRKVIQSRQKTGEWICNAPYGYYLHPTKKNEVCIDSEGAEVVNIIFDLYNKGWGYKKIGHYLTDNGYPTGLMLMKKQMQKQGRDTSKIEPRINPVWSIISISKIVTNDFYIGTLRQNMWTRKGINKSDTRVDEKEHIVFENHHEAILDKEIFRQAVESKKDRDSIHYKGIRKFENPYSGRIFCADCGSRMIVTTRTGLAPRYICHAYHKHGISKNIGCTSHRIPEKQIDNYVKQYIKKAKDSLVLSINGIDVAQSLIKVRNNSVSINELEKVIEETKSNLKQTTKQKIKKITLNPEDEELISEMYEEIEKDYHNEIKRLSVQVEYLKNESTKRAELKNNLARIVDIFDQLLKKEQFTKQDTSLIIDKITVDQDRIVTIKLKATIEELSAIAEEDSTSTDNTDHVDKLVKIIIDGDLE